MSIEEKLRGLSDRVKNHSSAMVSEEAVKTAVVLPFLSALGYDVFDPSEVIPEFTADAVGKKGEKVDYAIQIDGKIRILIECKANYVYPRKAAPRTALSLFFGNGCQVRSPDERSDISVSY